MRPVTFSHLRSSKAFLERPQEGVGAFGIARWRLWKLRPGGLFQTNSADEFWEVQSPTTCHGWFCRQIIGTEAWWIHRAVERSWNKQKLYAAMQLCQARLCVLLCALLGVSYAFLCLARLVRTTLSTTPLWNLFRRGRNPDSLSSSQVLSFCSILPAINWCGLLLQWFLIQ